MKTFLAVGINDYPGTDSDLSGCINDAADWANVFHGMGFTGTVLQDAAATKEALLQQLRIQVSALKKGDTFIFQYSGHGTWVVDTDGDEADRRDEALCPHDIMIAGPLTDDELYEVFSAKAFGSKVIFISDSCHSGTLARFAPELSERPKHAARIKYLPPAIWLRNPAVKDRAARAIRAPLTSRARMGALVLSGSGDAEFSYDAWFDGRANGAFTYAAIRALNTGTPISVSSSSSSSSSSWSLSNYQAWHRAIRKKLPSVDYPQSPQLDGTYAQKRWAVLA